MFLRGIMILYEDNHGIILGKRRSVNALLKALSFSVVPFSKCVLNYLHFDSCAIETEELLSSMVSRKPVSFQILSCVDNLFPVVLKGCHLYSVPSKEHMNYANHSG